MYVIINVDGSVYTGKSNNEMPAEEAAKKTYDMMANGNPAMLAHLSTGGILVLGPEVLARAHITYYDEEE